MSATRYCPGCRAELALEHFAVPCPSDVTGLTEVEPQDQANDARHEVELLRQVLAVAFEHVTGRCGCDPRHWDQGLCRCCPRLEEALGVGLGITSFGGEPRAKSIERLFAELTPESKAVLTRTNGAQRRG